MTSKQSLPLIIVSIDQTLPNINSEYKFLIHEKIANLKSTKSLNKNDKFYLTFSTKQNSTLDFTSFEKTISFTGPIGLECSFIQSTSLEELNEITCFINKEIYLKKITSTEEQYLAEGFKVDFLDDLPDEALQIELMSFILFIVSKIKDFPNETLSKLKQSNDLMTMCNVIAYTYFKDVFDSYIYLQTLEKSERVKQVVTAILESDETIVDLSIKDFILLNQVQGAESVNSETKFKKATSKKEKKEFPDYVKEALQKEVKRLSRTPGSSLEAQAIQNYIETIQNIPWCNYAKLNYELDSIVETIDKTHYGLNEVKQHVLEHLVLESHLQDRIGTVLCFIGPPGTGKTSIAKTIAKATNRKLIRLALGGVSDEAEIRGHRRTYVAAKPGRLVEGLTNVKQMNPVIILDEIDKLDKGTRGDPTSALLELLDPEQNDQFVDRFVEIPIDLSKCLFICTANEEENIPSALRDRLEFIYFEEYTFDERLSILENYIYPDLLKKYKMDSLPISIENSFYKELSKEKSLRKLEKNVSKILKSILVEIKLNKKEEILLSSLSKKYLNYSKPKTLKIGF